MKQQFEALVRAFCEAEQFAWPDILIDGEPVELEGVEFSFLYDDEFAPDAMHLRVVFGPAPLKDETAIFQMLLNENHIGYLGEGPGFCVSPSTGNVLYMLKLPLDQTTPELLAATLVYFTEKVAEWQRTYFLPPPMARRHRLHFS